VNNDTALMVSIKQDKRKKEALENALYAFLRERSAQMGEAYTCEMHEAAKAEDQDYISDIHFQVKSAIKAYEVAKSEQPVSDRAIDGDAVKRHAKANLHEWLPNEQPVELPQQTYEVLKFISDNIGPLVNNAGVSKQDISETAAMIRRAVREVLSTSKPSKREPIDLDLLKRTCMTCTFPLKTSEISDNKELFAKYIYEAMQWASLHTVKVGYTPNWQDHGNSDAQDRARAAANIILATQHKPVVSVDAAAALSKAILEAHAKWAAEYQGVSHVD